MRSVNLAAMQRPEPRTHTANAKLTASESDDLDKFVEFSRANGAPDATRSSAIRALVLDGLQVFKEEFGTNQ